MIETNDINQTNLLTFGAVLICEGFSLDGVVWRDGKCYFQFKISRAEFERLRREYFASRLTCDPKALFSALSTLRDALFQTKDDSVPAPEPAPTRESVGHGNHV